MRTNRIFDWILTNLFNLIAHLRRKLSRLISVSPLTTTQRLTINRIRLALSFPIPNWKVFIAKKNRIKCLEEHVTTLKTAWQIDEFCSFCAFQAKKRESCVNANKATQRKIQTVKDASVFVKFMCIILPLTFDSLITITEEQFDVNIRIQDAFSRIDIKSICTFITTNADYNDCNDDNWKKKPFRFAFILITSRIANRVVVVGIVVAVVDWNWVEWSMKIILSTTTSSAIWNLIVMFVLFVLLVCQLIGICSLSLSNSFVFV